MNIYELDLQLNKIGMEEVLSEFRYNGHAYMISLSRNPYNNDLLFSLFLDREPVVLNRVVVVGEYVLGSFGYHGFEDIIDCDFVFVPDGVGKDFGNRANPELLSELKLLQIIGG